ncbi:hypothetical protein COV06_04465 [Candidatus Uhrbacteria bacterium CG10_big_fil_rev_8_21_14_0_10_50_16]|uniref:LemA family protein n=1 Tax=Candidatus Uhrbacteria bacterium CG10_big_fil_rev_8_21_14_0_10_50_16 TaxID=1975039 RepID=A0A2H0RLK1_9BACT|nr:MAG: hypothetical protein COV06_04465 [Candidatus Uhrbacteria bacterium CG10_big_fil_rev_8_21_14_0_10_50_16]
MYAIIFLFGLIIVLGLATLVFYNLLITKRNRVDEAWSDIDVQLKRRHDLIPNLIETVKGAASHERETLEAVVKARAAAMTAQASKDPKAIAESENTLSGTLKSIFALSENYPALRANENFLELQRELSDTENKLQASRRFYNGQVRDFNTAIQKFPGVLIAGALSFKKYEFFGATEEERENVQVKF